MSGMWDGRSLLDEALDSYVRTIPPEPWQIEVAVETENFLSEICLRRGLEPEQVYEALLRVVRAQRNDTRP